jgi:hypothetical protein
MPHTVRVLQCVGGKLRIKLRLLLIFSRFMVLA